MGIFDLILGNFSPAPKIYRSDIQAIPGNRFPRKVRVKIGDQQIYLEGVGLRDWLARLAQNGITKTSMEKKLRTAGLAESQYARRKEIMAILFAPKPKPEKRERKDKLPNNGGFPTNPEREKERRKREKEFEIKSITRNSKEKQFIQQHK